MLTEPTKNEGTPRRSREGAWIEIHYFFHKYKYSQRRSREGAWIEICFLLNYITHQRVAPARERGLKS